MRPGAKIGRIEYIKVTAEDYNIPISHDPCYNLGKEDKNMAQRLEPVTFDEFLSNAASIFA